VAAKGRVPVEATAIAISCQLLAPPSAGRGTPRAEAGAHGDRRNPSHGRRGETVEGVAGGGGAPGRGGVRAGEGGRGAPPAAAPPHAGGARGAPAPGGAVALHGLRVPGGRHAAGARAGVPAGTPGRVRHRHAAAGLGGGAVPARRRGLPLHRRGAPRRDLRLRGDGARRGGAVRGRPRDPRHALDRAHRLPFGRGVAAGRARRPRAQPQGSAVRLRGYVPPPPPPVDSTRGQEGQPAPPPPPPPPPPAPTGPVTPRPRPAPSQLPPASDTVPFVPPAPDTLTLPPAPPPAPAQPPRRGRRGRDTAQVPPPAPPPFPTMPKDTIRFPPPR
jgi:hypothetical protein